MAPGGGPGGQNKLLVGPRAPQRRKVDRFQGPRGVPEGPGGAVGSHFERIFAAGLPGTKKVGKIFKNQVFSS